LLKQTKVFSKENRTNTLAIINQKPSFKIVENVNEMLQRFVIYICQSS